MNITLAEGNPDNTIQYNTIITLLIPKKDIQLSAFDK